MTKATEISSRNDLYKCLALMALALQGKPIDEKLLDNYVDRGIPFEEIISTDSLFEELPIPIIDTINNLEDRLIRLLRNNQAKSTLCFRYNDLCALDTVQIEIVPEKKGNNNSTSSRRLSLELFTIRCHFRIR